MEPFKNQINEQLLREMAGYFSRQWQAFPAENFLKLAGKDLSALELKQRVKQVAEALARCLPEDFPQAADLIERCLAPAPSDDKPLPESLYSEGLAGWPIWPLTEFVALRGLNQFDRALDCLRQLTQRASAEFAIRSFLQADAARCLATLHTWLNDPSPHVRRLISEGTRPRLPWGLQLRTFIRDPSPCLPLLEHLHRDPSEYVRRSVANHLNDISKDHPELAVATAERWLVQGASTTTSLVSHALRSLVKQGHAHSLALLGFDNGGQIKLENLELQPAALSLGETLEIRFLLRNKGRAPASLVIDYAVHHLKANGSLLPKVFKGTRKRVEGGGSCPLVLRHPLRKVTTRTYYPGRHLLDIRVNGRCLGEGAFVLLP